MSRASMPGPVVSRLPERSEPVRFEDMLSLVEAQRKGRLAMRRVLREEGSLHGPLVDRDLLVLSRLSTFLARCIVVRGEVFNLVRHVAVAPLDQEDGG